MSAGKWVYLPRISAPCKQIESTKEYDGEETT